MADKKISDLQLRTNVDDSVQFPVDDGIQTYKVTAPQLKNYVAPIYLVPTVQRMIGAASGTLNLIYAFLINSASATVGATYTNNGITYTVVKTISSSTLVYASGSGAPTTSGTLTKSGGTGASTLTFQSFKRPNVLVVEMIGGGGGGGGGGGTPDAGGDTTFGDHTSGGGGAGRGNGSVPDDPGEFTLGDDADDLGCFNGATSSVGSVGTVSSVHAGLNGAPGLSGTGGGRGASSGANDGGSGQPGTGAGGGGGGANTGWGAASGGCSGAPMRFQIVNPEDTYAWEIGAGGAGVGGGTSNGGSGDGADGSICVTFKYQG